MTDHDAHVVEKRRHGGDRDGEVVYYAVGPVRRSREHAQRDLLKLGSKGMGKAELLSALKVVLAHEKVERAKVRRAADQQRREREKGQVDAPSSRPQST